MPTYINQQIYRMNIDVKAANSIQFPSCLRLKQFNALLLVTLTYVYCSSQTLVDRTLYIQ